VVLLAAKAKAFMTAEPMTIPRIADRVQRRFACAASAHGAANCEASRATKPIDADGHRPGFPGGGAGHPFPSSAIKVRVSSPMLATSALASAALRELEEVTIQSSFRLQFF
jgi:hypothetical protein